MVAAKTAEAVGVREVNRIRSRLIHRGGAVLYREFFKGSTSLEWRVLPAHERARWHRMAEKVLRLYIQRLKQLHRFDKVFELGTKD